MTTQDEKGWIEWNGGECPVSPSTRVQLHLRLDDGDLFTSEKFDPAPANGLRWTHTGGLGDIIAYRVVQP